jgi:hypothetical protein
MRDRRVCWAGEEAGQRRRQGKGEGKEKVRQGEEEGKAWEKAL